MYVSINKSLTFLFACVRASVLSVAQRQLLDVIVHVILIQVVLILYSLHVEFLPFRSKGNIATYQQSRITHICRHLNLYWLILMVPGLSDDNLKSLISECVLKTTRKVLENEFKKLPFNLIRICPFEGGACLACASVARQKP